MSADDLFAGEVPQARLEQFRMRRLQVYNWGTFSGLHDIPIAERGFLFVGRSGSGKSTLLDAMAALLVPAQWLDFNAAAREAERSGRDRSLVSYVRGAWADRQDDSSGEVATQYLRRGTAWSALALEYRNGLGRCISVVRLFWLSGNSNAAADVRKHYLVAERPFDLDTELQGFDLDLRKLKKRLTTVFHHDNFSAYSERFKRLLGIDNDNALRLLHKTQSAKNLGDLNRFLREFMLDRPQTFDAAARLVDEFVELDAAHAAVVAARRQIELLQPARLAHQRLLAARIEVGIERELLAGVDGFRERQLLCLLEARLNAIGVEDAGIEARQRGLAELGLRHEGTLAALHAEYQASGGERIEFLQRELRRLEQERLDRLKRLDRATAACLSLDWTLANTPERFAEQRDSARQQLENSAEHLLTLEQELDQARADKREADINFVRICGEIEAMKRSPSNIPAPMQMLRGRLCEALGLDEGALAFAGELLQVRAEHAPWRGAIERLLHGFAQALLVDERYYAKVAAWVDATHLRGKLVYYRVQRSDVVQAQPAAVDSLLRKLEPAPHPQSAWLWAELQRRFDYDCVESVQKLRERTRALTREGQIKHGSQRHEKDDRFAIDDPRKWLLGFDNRDKRKLFEADASALEAQRLKLEARIAALTQQRTRSAARDAAARELSHLDWHEIDVASVLHTLTELEAQLQHLRASSQNLQQLDQRIAHARERLEKLRQQQNRLEVDRQTLDRERKKREREHDLCVQQIDRLPLSVSQQEGLAARQRELGESTLDTLQEHSRLIERGLNQGIARLEQELTSLSHAITDRFATFMREWKEESGDFRAELDFAGDFFARLQRLEHDGLPAFEARFFDLLRTQSGQNLAALQTYISQAHKAIRVRMLDVNAALERVAFNRGTRLKIRVEDRRLPEVAEFRQQLTGVLSHRQTADRELAERQFDALRRLIQRLAAKDAEALRWREQVLDVRLHVEFIGEEIEAESGRQVEVYRSGAGKSGGQRQKLATTCLAAALRYQLGSEDDGLPRYAAVVLDEAFDKADNEFTAMAMSIFENFGFQMVVATPLKSVMTLEPFIGGACFVDISGRHDSGVLLVEYDEAQQRLQLPEATLPELGAS